MLQKRWHCGHNKRKWLKQPQSYFHWVVLHKSQYFSLFWCILCTVTPDISRSTENVINVVRVSRLSFRFVWLRWFYKTRLTCKRLFSCQILQKKDNEITFSTIRSFYFDRGIKIILREFFQTGTILCEKLIYMFIYCFIDKNPHISLYIVFSSKWIMKEAPQKRKADAFYYCYYYYYYYHHYHYYHFYYYYY